MTRKIRTIKGLIITALATTLFLAIGCSQPNLESDECRESRDMVKKFYSFHIGNDMRPSANTLAKRKEFLSKALVQSIAASTDTNTDYFTQTDNYPKASRVGACTTLNKRRASFEVLLFWRTDDKDVQQEIYVEAVNENSKWLIDKVSSKN